MVKDKGMDPKQWAWLYGQIKGYIRDHEGHAPDDKAVSDFWELHDYIMKTVSESPKKRPGTDEQLMMVFKPLTAIMQALELEGKPL